MAFSKTLKEKKLIIQCDSCFKEITLDPFVRCAECVWDQCLHCAMENVEASQHRKTHSYRLISNLSESLLCKDWRVIDELLLLNGVITFGIGNFEDIASILSPKTENEVKKHFFELFQIEDNDEGECFRSHVPKSDPNDSLVLSYMSKRGEFDSEIHNDYESVISNIQFYDTDSPLEINLKTHMLGHYRTVIRQRGMWRNYILDRNLVEVNYIKRMEMGEFGPLINQYKWILQYISKNDFNKFIRGLIKEKKLRSLIRSKKDNGSRVDEERLLDVSGILGPTEKELCRRLNMTYTLYARLKRFAIECYIMKRPLSNLLVGLFGDSERERADILYRWFKDQQIVYSDDRLLS